VAVRSLDEGEHEDYLGVPMGTRLTFRPASSLPGKLTLVADSDLAPGKSWRFSAPTCCPRCLTISLPAASSEASSTRSTRDALNFSATLPMYLTLLTRLFSLLTGGRVDSELPSSRWMRTSGSSREPPSYWTVRTRSSAFLPAPNWNSTSRRVLGAHALHLSPSRTTYLALHGGVFTTPVSTGAALTPGRGLGRRPED
jgi:hypothetical protein